jgi:hypothetical protein
MKEDPTRDPASEARDDHASEPRETPETDYAAWGETDVVEASFARRLKRQRDELLEACNECDEAFGKFCPDLDSRYGMAWATVKAAIAAVKGGDQ